MRKQDKTFHHPGDLSWDYFHKFDQIIIYNSVFTMYKCAELKIKDTINKMLLEHFLTTESKKGKRLVQKVIITYFSDFDYVKIIPGFT